jgi:hypothetical protein
LTGVTAIAAGGRHTVALKKDGTLVAFGLNDNGQVTGIPTTEGSSSAIASPVILGGRPLTGVVAIAAGDTHTVALRNDGTVMVWGYPASPDDESDCARGRPLTLGGDVLTGVTAIAAGGRHTLAMKNDGTMVAWGSNYSGEVTGTPTTGDELHAIASPVRLEGQTLRGVTAIAAGPNHSVALVTGGLGMPSLTSKSSGNELVLSWPTNAAGFTLQSTLNLTPPVTWIDSTQLPGAIGAQFVLTNTPFGNARYYRLRKP